jgi:hypothetical protein
MRFTGAGTSVLQRALVVLQTGLSLVLLDQSEIVRNSDSGASVVKANSE